MVCSTSNSGIAKEARCFVYSKEQEARALEVERE